MAKLIKQIIVETIDNKNVIQDCRPVYKLGIQFNPQDNVTFSLNGSSSMRIGRYGIYELDLTGLGGWITSLTFSGKNTSPIIVDIIYESEVEV